MRAPTDRTPQRALRGLVELRLAKRSIEEWIALSNVAAWPCHRLLDPALALARGGGEGSHMTQGPERLPRGATRVLPAVRMRGSGDGWLRSAPPEFGQYSRYSLEEPDCSVHEMYELVSGQIVGHAAPRLPPIDRKAGDH